MMKLEDISTLHRQFWRRGYGAVVPSEVDYIQSLIVRHKPESFIEIGMASGMSTGFISRFMDDQGGGRLVSLDHDDTFFGDMTKHNGFLYPEIYQGEAVQSELIKFKTSLDIHDIKGEFEMAFIDANHQHPWPALDMMALYPRMSGPKIMIHHDLRLFKDNVRGIGPKYLYDQFPQANREKSNANYGNIFSVDLRIEQDQFETLLSDLFELPWTIRNRLTPATVEKIGTILKRDYSTEMYDIFMRCEALNANRWPFDKVDILTTINETNDKVAQLIQKVEHVETMVARGMVRRVYDRLKR